jgi:hypothetical protein
MQSAFRFLIGRPDAVTTAGCRRTRLAPSTRDRQSVASSPVASFRVTTDMTGVGRSDRPGPGNASSASQRVPLTCSSG